MENVGLLSDKNKITTMSYSLIGHFVDVHNKKIIVSAELGFMKNLNTMRYSNEFENITATGTAKDEDYPEITEHTYTEFQGYYQKSVINDPELKDNFIVKEKTHKEGINGYCFDKAFIEEHKEIFEKYEVHPTLEELMKKDSSEDIEKKYLLLYYREAKKNHGTWFKPNDFEDAVDDIKKEYEEKKARIDKLKSLKDTRDWFEMSEEARNNLLKELGWAEEDFQDADWKYWAIQKMVNILDFIKEDVGFMYKDETGSTRYMWNYDDKREIEIYIEVD